MTNKVKTPSKNYHPRSTDTSWEKSANWYQKIVGQDGHYYHQQIVIPNVLRLLELNSSSKLLDLGCGQGILARSIPKIKHYQGVDSSAQLINIAKKSAKSDQAFMVADATKPLRLDGQFTHTAIILALQNMESISGVFNNVSKLSTKQSQLVLVINHPSFRIPRQSDWGTEPANKQNYRKVFTYMTELKIPIKTHPGMQDSPLTWSYHWPLETLVKGLKEIGFAITDLEEWCSDKSSDGKNARAENRARQEIPMFMAIKAAKLV